MLLPTHRQAQPLGLNPFQKEVDVFVIFAFISSLIEFGYRLQRSWKSQPQHRAGRRHGERSESAMLGTVGSLSLGKRGQGPGAVRLGYVSSFFHNKKLPHTMVFDPTMHAVPHAFAAIF